MKTLNKKETTNRLESTKNINNLKMNLIKTRLGSIKREKIINLLALICETHFNIHGIDLFPKHLKS